MTPAAGTVTKNQETHLQRLFRKIEMADIVNDQKVIGCRRQTGSGKPACIDHAQLPDVFDRGGVHFRREINNAGMSPACRRL